MTRTTRPPSQGRFRAILGYASLALVVFLVFAGFRGFRDLNLARERVERLEQEIALTEAEIEQLGRTVERLREDPVMLERLAREELGMVRPGDVVVVLETEPPPSQDTATAAPEPSSEPSSGRRAPASP